MPPEPEALKVENWRKEVLRGLRTSEGEGFSEAQALELEFIGVDIREAEKIVRLAPSIDAAFAFLSP